MNTSKKFRPFLWLMITLVLLGYVLPWVMNPAQVLDLNAYDLAEWLSLRPALSTAFLLRAQLLIITCLIAFSSRPPRRTASWWFRLTSVLILCVAQLPPLEFISNTGDSNQQQQALLATLSLTGGIAGLSTWLSRYQHYALISLSLTGIITSLIALPQAFSTMQAYQLPTTVDAGVFVLIAGYSFICLYSIYALNKQSRHQRP